jgi:hypothetical protein
MDSSVCRGRFQEKGERRIHSRDSQRRERLTTELKISHEV